MTRFPEVVMVVFLAAAALATVVVPPMDERAAVIKLRADEVIGTFGGKGASYRYYFPDYAMTVMNGANVISFGVKTSGGATLILHDTSQSKYPDIVMNIVHEIGDEMKWCRSYLNKSATAYSDYKWMECSLLDPDRYVWFSVERTNGYIAVHREGKYDPVAVVHVFNNDYSKANLNLYYMFSVSSEKDAAWKFTGYGYDYKAHTEVIDFIPLLKYGLRQANSNYKHLKQYFARCNIHRHPHIAKQMNQTVIIKYNIFSNKYCSSRLVYHPFKDSLERHKVINHLYGLPEPKATLEEALDFFNNVYYS